MSADSSSSMDFLQPPHSNKHKGTIIELSHLHHASNPNHPQGGDNSNEPVYFSRITQQWEPVWFYATMLKKLGSFAQAIDRCARTSRELVWSHIFYLYNQPNRKCSDLFTPIIDEWCQSQSIDLSALEIMYTSFLQIYNTYPGLFEDVLTPSPSSSSLNNDGPSFSYSSMPFGDGKSDFKKEDSQKIKLIKLNNTSLIWGNSFASSLQQFSLLLNWAALLEKLPPNQKEAIWNTCQFFPVFSSDVFDRASFRKTFLKWAGNLPAHLTHITILFGAIGFLRDKGIIKHQFFYPNTTVPVFNRGAKSQPNTPTTPQYVSTPGTPHFPPSPLVAPPSPSPHLAPSPSIASRPTSPLPSSGSSTPDFHHSTTPIHHFFPSLHTTPSTHSVLPALDGATPRSSKPLPFESLSLPPLAMPPPSAPLPVPSLHSTSSSSGPALPPPSSRLGLLALAAFQADDTTEAAAAASKLNKAPSTVKQEGTKSAPESDSTQATDAKTTTVAESSSEVKPKLETTDSQTPLPQTSSSPADKVKLESAPTPTMKIVKRKNSSCADYHEDDNKRPRTMNLSHILCS